MLVEKYLKSITEESIYTAGKKLFEAGGIVAYSEKKELKDVYEIEAKIMKDGKVFNVDLFINTDEEYLSNFNCQCYYYSICSHVVAAVMRFHYLHGKKHPIKDITDGQKYEYKIMEKNREYFFAADYESELNNWIGGHTEYSEKVREIIDSALPFERALIYSARAKNSFKMDNEMAEYLSKLKLATGMLEIRNAFYNVDTDGAKILVAINSNVFKEKSKGVLYIKKTSAVEDEDRNDLSPEFIFERLPKYMASGNIVMSKSFEKYMLSEKPAKYKLIFEESDGKINLIPEIMVGKDIFKGLDILKIDTKYKKITHKEWEKIDENKLKKYIAFLKTKHLKYVDGSFICTNEFFSEDYHQIDDEWSKVGIKEESVEAMAELSINGRKGKLDISYSVNNKNLDRKEVLKINEVGYIKRDRKIVLIKNRETVIIEDRVEDTKENIICFLEKLKKIGDINVKNNILNTINIPDKFEPILRNYQKEGFKWLYFLYNFNFGGILADDMGLGKTVQTLSLINAVEDNGLFMILAPKTLLFNWKDEILKFLGISDIVVYDGEKEKRESLLEEIKQIDAKNSRKIILSSYSIIKKDYHGFKDIRFNYIILDEAQHIKNHDTVISKIVRGLKSKRRLALTGTPIENNIKELWSIFEFALPGYLGKFERYLLDGGIDELKYRTAPFILRRTKKEVLKELPEKIEQILKVELNPKQQKLYDNVLGDMRRKIDGEIEKQGIKKSYFAILAAITYLREICNHPELIGEKDYESSKMDLFEELIEDAVEGGHKILVFSQFVKMLDILKESLKAKGIGYEYLSGDTKNRMEAVNNFNENPDIKVFLISLKAGGVGLNLTSADVVIHIDPWWNPMVENQATDRAHRIGQTKKINVYKIITKGTIEEKILEIQNRKREIFDSIINSEADSTKEISLEDLKELFE